MMTGYVDGAGQAGSRLRTTGWDGYPQRNCQVEIHGVQICGKTRQPAPGVRPIFMILAVDPGFHCDEFTLTIYPSIMPSGNYQNVFFSPANQAKLTLFD